MCVCRFGISYTYVIKHIDSKIISVCLINDYSLIADLHIFVYGSAECAFISLECTEVKLPINNFAFILGVRGKFLAFRFIEQNSNIA